MLVVVSAYPLAQLVSYLGGKALDVIDLAPPGARSQGLSLTPAQQSMVRAALLVIDVGDGYQPRVEAAAATAHRHISVLPAVSRQARPYEFWLDPYLMARAATVIAGALTTADPAEREQFQNGARDFQAVANSVESDFVNNFTQCARNEFVTADDAFGRMAASFDLADVAVTTTGVNKAVALVVQGSLPAVFSEIGVPSGAVQQVARDSRVSVKSLDPMEITPSAGTSALSYFSVMEEDLTALEGPLACDTSEDFA
jgi:ABC-type Zn uptake system ZnuABC Zn-binding protein ZnuA